MEEQGEEEDSGSVHSSDSRKEGSYRVVGTLKDPTSKPENYVAEVINVSCTGCVLFNYQKLNEAYFA